jgi:hypothetical protein
MSIRAVLILLATAPLASALLAGCVRVKDPYYCPGRNPNDNCDEPPEPLGCTSNDQCADPTAVCDGGGSLTCVQCTPDQASACTGATPACGDDRTCRACRAHAECTASETCLPDGSCADPVQVAYVAPTGTDNASCTKSTPCTKVAKALATTRPYVKLAGSTDEGGTLTIDNRNVTLLAEPDAKLVRTSNGLHVEVKGSSQVEIYDLEISGASGAQGVGISMPTGNTAKLTLKRVKLANNTGGGISATAGTLIVDQSTISDNTGGGISVSNAQFDNTNSNIVKNGSPSAGYGGVSLSQSNTGMRRFEFNTIAQNQATSGISSGVLCLAIGTPLTFSNSIVYANGTGPQVEGNNCSWTYSDIGPDMVTGMGNINAPPMFVSPMQNDFHLQPGSPARDAADPAATLLLDIDGDARPQGLARDIGADELK